MPYFPTYEEMQEALESARLKMWHEHGKVVDYGGPEFTLYVMEGLGKMEAPKILDEPREEDVEPAVAEGAEEDVVQVRDDGGSAPDPVSVPAVVTVTKSFGVEGDVRGVVGEGEGDIDVVAEGAASSHPFRSDRSGKRCLDCRKPRSVHVE